MNSNPTNERLSSRLVTRWQFVLIQTGVPTTRDCTRYPPVVETDRLLMRQVAIPKASPNMEARGRAARSGCGCPASTLRSSWTGHE